MRLLTLCVAVGAAIAQDCVFQFDDDGVKFDLSSLASEAPFSLAYGGANYQYSVCKALSASCNGATNLMAIATAPGDPSTCFASFGEPGSPQATILGSAGGGSGLQLQYSGGKCNADPSQTSKAVYDIRCDKDGGVTPHLVQLEGAPLTSCELRLEFASSAGCAQQLSLAEVLSPAGLAALIVLALVVVYLVGGTAYNMMVRGASGMEALPNVDFWRGVCSRAGACCGCTGPPGGASGFYDEMDVDVLGDGEHEEDAPRSVVPDSHV